MDFPLIPDRIAVNAAKALDNLVPKKSKYAYDKENKRMGSAPAPAIGIDLGTSFSVAAVYRKGKSEVIPNLEGQRLTPSFILYHPDALEVSIGTTADDLSPKWIDNFLFDMKRYIGRKYDDVYVQELKKREEYKFHVVNGENEKAEIELLHDGVKVSKTPEQASSEILKYLRESASAFLGAEVTEAVISIPAHFSNAQRKATRAAAELAGLKVLKLLTEPVSAAIHYSEDRLDTEATFLVFDFGGGTLDVSVIEVDDKKFTVKSVEGDTFLGGRDIDKILLDYFKNAMIRSFGNDIFNTRLLRRVEEFCVRLKVKLSTKEKYSLPMYCIGGVEDRNFTFSLSRLELESLTEDLFKRALNLAEVCLKEAGLSKEHIDKVILVGGTTRIPKVRQMLSSYFGSSKIHIDINPDEAVALGAALQAAKIKEKFQELEKYHITEVTPLSLGMETYFGLMDIFIKKNTVLPFISKPVCCITAENNQFGVVFPIYEGERKNCRFNNFLGSFEIIELPLKKAGEVSFEVRFSLTEDGILEVTAKEMSTAKSDKLVVTIGEFRLSDYKIRRTIEDAIINKKEDEEFEAEVMYKRKINYNCNYILYDLEKIVSVGERQNVRERVKKLQDMLKNTKLSVLREEYKSFKRVIKPLITRNKVFIYLSDNEE